MTVALTADPTAATPLQHRDGRWYKRDDLLRFTNGVNGKVRTSLYLTRQAKASGHTGVVYGGSVHAPALGRVASAAALTGLDCHIVIGSDPAKAVRHDTVRVAAEAGARLVRNPVAYNPALQKRARQIAADSDGRIMQIPYGVSSPEHATPQQVTEFLNVDAPQTDQLADTPITTLVIPFGSGNGAAGILYGLATRNPGHIRRVVLVSVGPDRTEWLRQRMRYVGVDLDRQPFTLTRMPLHPDFAQYADRMPATCDGIAFHPTYEGKIIHYLAREQPDWWTHRDDTTCLWIIGGPLS